AVPEDEPSSAVLEDEPSSAVPEGGPSSAVSEDEPSSVVLADVKGVGTRFAGVLMVSIFKERSCVLSPTDGANLLVQNM
ncbi:hypothetical protein Tco_1574733, partial [Tanacetum coccineum]